MERSGGVQLIDNAQIDSMCSSRAMQYDDSGRQIQSVRSYVGHEPESVNYVEKLEKPEEPADIVANENVEVDPRSMFAPRPQQLHSAWSDLVDGSQLPTVDSLMEHVDEETRKRGGVGKINVKALAFACAQSLHRTDTPSFSVLGFGSFNVCLRATFCNGPEAVARIPIIDTRVPGQVSSAVATMAFARFRLDIPTPIVYAWNDDNDNPVNAPYIIMELDKGVSLAKVWTEGLSSEYKFYILAEVAKYHAALTRATQFTSFGNLFFSKDVAQGLWTDLTHDKAYEVGRFIRVRHPIVGSAYSMEWPSGPVKDVRTLWYQGFNAECRMLCNRWQPIDEQGPILEPNPNIRAFVGMPEGLKWRDLRYVMNIIYRLIAKCRLVHGRRSCLVHGDISFNNVHVDPEWKRLTKLVDWEGAAILPLDLMDGLPKDLYMPVGPDSASFFSGRIYSSLLGLVQRKSPDLDVLVDALSPGSLATRGDDWIEPLSEIGDVVTDLEQCQLRKLYVYCLYWWSADLHPSLWQKTAFARFIHDIVTFGGLGWYRRLALLKELDKPDRQWLVPLARIKRSIEALRVVFTSFHIWFVNTCRRVYTYVNVFC